VKRQHDAGATSSSNARAPARYNFNSDVRMSLIRTLRQWTPVSLGIAVLATAICPSRAFPQDSAAKAGEPARREDFKLGDENREADQRATDLLKAMGVSRGDWVADVGAGNGYYSMRLSEIVGAEGKVFAEDISTYSIDGLDRRLKAFDLRNVEIVKGEADNPKLPSESLAAVLIVDSYHHFTQYQSMLGQLLHALKPGGRLVIADYSLPAHRTQSRADQLKIHEIDPESVRAECAQAGFQVLRCDDPFVKDVKTGRIGLVDLYLLVAVRPK
jgi:predicted methyltransferase